MSKLAIKWVFTLILLVDLAFSFRQHCSMPLDGDMAAIVLPADWYKQVLDDPFGLDILKTGEGYGGAGRYFCHWSMSAFYNNVPIYLQSFFSPISSVYYSTGIIKTTVQLLFIWLLALFVIGGKKNGFEEIFLAAVLITPLFQSHGYNLIIGVIEKSPTYFFFYSLPIVLLLLFAYPYFSSKKIKWKIWFPITLILSIVLPFSSPILPGVVFVAVAMLFCFFSMDYFKNGKINWKNIDCPSYALFPLFILLAFSVYSFCLGQFNPEQSTESVPLGDKYLFMLEGLYMQFSQKLAYPLLLAAIAFNIFSLYKKSSTESDELLRKIKWVAIFCLLYLLLLPLGGSREYRSLIVRHDTMMPVTICMFYIFGATTYFLLKITKGKKAEIYKVGVAVFLLLFTIADAPNFQHNLCEKQALETIANSPEKEIVLEKGCNILSWGDVVDPEESWMNMQLLKKWRIIKKDKLYHQ